MKHHAHTGNPVKSRRPWWQWAAVGLMLLAIGTYVLTLDDSVVPGAGTPPPAASGGPGQ